MRRKSSREFTEAVRKHFGYTCQMCGSKKNLTVHHVLERSKGGKDVIENACLLCRPCHDSVHVDYSIGIVCAKTFWEYLYAMRIENDLEEVEDEHIPEDTR